MLPKTALGKWVLLIFIVLFLLYGVSGGFAVAGNIVHSAITGVQSFAHHAKNG